MNASLLAWLTFAARDLSRHKAQTALLGLSLFFTTLLLALPLLVGAGLDHARAAFFAQSPSVLLRRLEPGGFAAFPLDSLPAIREVPGVLEAFPRLWGVVRGPDGPVTLWAFHPHFLSSERPDSALNALGFPVIGEAIPGPGVVVANDRTVSLNSLRGDTCRAFRVRAELGASLGFALQDAVLLHPADVRDLLGLSAGQASDVAVNVFHDEEEQAILPDLLAALPFAARAATRSEAQGEERRRRAEREGLLLLSLVPALLALSLLVLHLQSTRLARRREMGLFKALGWTGGEILRFFALRALLIGVPSTVAGLFVAYGLVFWPWNAWLVGFLGSWPSAGPTVGLSPQAAPGPLLLALFLVLAPWLVASMWVLWNQVSEDAHALLVSESEGG